MGKISDPQPAKLFTAITYNDTGLLDRLKQVLERHFGTSDYQSPSYPFKHTDYYRKEMGGGLEKYFISFEPLVDPGRLAEIKLTTNEIEGDFSGKGKRRVNLDPGFLEMSKVVMATTKNFGHRIYLGRGVYGDLHLRYLGGKFNPMAWTYPDYREKIALSFFSEIRRIYLEQLKGLSKK